MKRIELALASAAVPRVRLGAQRVREALEEAGYQVTETDSWTLANCRSEEVQRLVIGDRTEGGLLGELEAAEVLLYHTAEPEGEGYYLASLPGGLTAVVGGSPSGVLYGCQRLAAEVRAAGRLPRGLAAADAPVMKLRGPVVPLQKTTVEPPRRTYEYPVTPGRFPWFYDRSHWLAFIDQLLEERCNVLYIWTGHPFSSFVRVADYPEALEVTEEEFQLNVETFRWLAEQCDRRGIWVVLKFYNIHLPLPFAQKHGLDLHQPKPLPLTSDYYIQSIAEFIRSFPNVGLMVCLGEALNGALYGVEWFNETILAGVEQGLRDSGLRELPPIIVRAHAIPSEKVMAEALPRYANLYTEAKYNGESLTTYTPRGRWQDIHRHLSSLGSIHLFNVHILANLEPFRYGAPSFIQKCVQAAKYRLGTSGIHLYPLFYWDWPYAPDQTEPRLLQIERDWIWFAAWFRYAWNPDLEPRLERLYWRERLAERYGSVQAAEQLLLSYEEAGEIAPKLLRRFGITEGNRQTMSLGMTMSQLVNPARYSPWRELWDCQAPQGERLEQYVQREERGEPHVGETPLDIVGEVEEHAELALQAVEAARLHVVQHEEEFARLADDMRAIRLMSRAYTHKVRAAIGILTYKARASAGSGYLRGLELLEQAQPEWLRSLECYRELAELTGRTYRYANSMQTPQRKVPFPDGERYGHWQQCLPLYEAEYARFVAVLAELQAGRLPQQVAAEGEPITPYRQAPFTLRTADAQTYRIEAECSLFTEEGVYAAQVAEELRGLTGIRFSREQASREAVALELELPRPARVLVGYFQSEHPGWLQVPSLEENTHADDRGGLHPVIRHAVKVHFHPSIHVHAFLYEPGVHQLVLGRGAYAVLGVIDADQPLQVRDVEGASSAESLDWLYEA